MFLLATPASAIDKSTQLVIALVGNPNVGKTCIFNNLTGARQHVGNWPGVTVEKKEGYFIHKGNAVQVVDLPGIYSLGGHSEDEIVASDYLLSGKANTIINVVDASNIERNLYLTVQMLEMGINVIVALNLIDEANAKGITIDSDKLAQLLESPVIPTIATKRKGMAELISAAMHNSSKSKEPLKIFYGDEIEDELMKLEILIKQHHTLTAKFSPRWLAIKVLEGDEYALKLIAEHPDILHQQQQSTKHIEGILGQDAESAIIDRRYGFIMGLVKETVKREQTAEEKITTSDKIDKIVTHRLLGIPIFLLAMWLVFQFTFVVADPFMGYIESFFEWLGAWSGSLIANEVLASLVVDGIIGGVGSVLIFIPNIFLLFLAISFLEDSGYMARAAYVTDRFMHTLGLHGKSFIPLMIGFGCNVPAIMATRTLENKRDRLITILITPLMSCSARLPVYVLFVSAFFTAHQGLVVFSLYMLGIILAIMMGMLFKTFIFKGEQAPFVMELPPYRWPTLKGVLIHMWERGYAFIRKAGTIIFATVVLIWVLSNIPWGVDIEDSVIGMLGKILAPIFAPAGFGTWEAAVALFFGVLAKEVVVGTLAVVYGVGESGLTTVITQHFTPLSAYAFMVMTLLYIPCIAVIGVIKRETNSWRWTGFAAGYTLALGWITAVLVFQVGRLLGFN